jgi:hypothetical protein
MTKHEKRLQELCVIADDMSVFDKNRHAAAIYIGNKLISTGVNQLKSHPLQAKFGSNTDAIFLHAEIDQIRKHQDEQAVPRVPTSDHAFWHSERILDRITPEIRQ